MTSDHAPADQAGQEGRPNFDDLAAVLVRCDRCRDWVELAAMPVHLEWCKGEQF